ncbi:hypothetical protein V1512DRAFT_258776 [Lipomyces arxii]|uniref:uncharacterized protein n=1 Tax=Lipomyces arxii TaxID=56418 RepID=UPI0034CD3AA1
MVKLKEIPRTATFAWSPGAQLPFLASGTVAGAVDADFSSKSVLELWNLDLVDKSSDGFQLTKPVVSIPTDARFHDLAWGYVTPTRPKGIIAGALENGSLMIWDPEALIQDPSSAPLRHATEHTGAVKSIDFNPVQKNLLASAGSKSELLVWDLEKNSAPIIPGAVVSRVDEIECVAWNNSVSHILAAAGSSGFTSVWDLKSKREVLHLFYQGSSGSGRQGVSSVVWHPDNSTKLITAVEDDSSPVILMWDLRNANAPEKILKGHSQGILSLSWCKRDSDLLLSSGKDNRTLLWNPNSGELLGEFPIATNWTFESRWYERNPELFASASFDGKIAVQSLQNTKKPDQTEAVTKPEGNDFWNSAAYVDSQQPTISLKQPPKWLRRPVSASFGFGGKLVTVQMIKAQGKSKVKVHKFAIEPTMASETEKFAEALKSQNLSTIAETRETEAASDKEKRDWSVLLALYDANPKQKLMDYLGYSADKLETVFEKFERLTVRDGEETPQANGVAADAEVNTTDAKETKPEDTMFGESTTEDPFLSSISVHSPATNGEKPSSPGAFTIFGSDTEEADKLITQALLLGKFSTAVDICLKADRLSDAFMLALSGDEECRQKVQQAYFKKNDSGPSYIRILSSVVRKNLSDLVNNANISNWKEVVVALSTFASDSEFQSLIATLGDRLSEARKTADSDDEALELRHSATLCYLAGSKLEKLVAYWVEELADSEKDALSTAPDDVSPFAIHIKSLQDFVEKVTVFRNAVKYTDPGEKSASTDDWSLAPLYEAYREYANIVASQGFLELSQKYLSLLPTQYPFASLEQERVAKACTKVSRTPATASAPAATAIPSYTAPTNTYTSPYANPLSTSLYAPAAPTDQAATTSPYAPAQSSTYQPPAPAAPSTYDASTPYGHAYRSSVNIPAPPPLVTPPIHHQQPHDPLPPPPITHTRFNKDVGGWNDTPVMKSATSSRRATPSTAQPILSPFPGMQPPATPQPYAQSTSTPAFGQRAPPASVPPPPTNAKPPQSVTVSPVQSPPPTRPAGATSSSYAPSPKVEFVSLAPSAPPTTATPAQSTYMPTGAALPGVNSPYAPPPAAAEQSRPPNPYAPAPSQQQPQQQRSVNPYAPVAPPPISQPMQTLPRAGPPPMSSYVPPPPSTGGSQYGAGHVPHIPGPPSVARTVSPVQSVIAPPSNAPPPKFPAGDRTHISATAKPIFDILSTEMARVKRLVPASVARQVKDAEKRLNMLFDHLNNQDMLSDETVREMIILAEALKARDFDTAYAVHVNLITTRTDECEHWMIGVKRLLDMSRQC